MFENVTINAGQKHGAKVRGNDARIKKSELCESEESEKIYTEHRYNAKR